MKKAYSTPSILSAVFLCGDVLAESGKINPLDPDASVPTWTDEDGDNPFDGED